MTFLSRIFNRGMSCQQVAALLQQYLDDELDVSDVPKVLDHLEACRRCGLEAEMYTRIKNSLLNHRESPSEDSMSRIRTLADALAVGVVPEGVE